MTEFDVAQEIETLVPYDTGLAGGVKTGVAV
jgi:hypothetical protein